MLRKYTVRVILSTSSVLTPTLWVVVPAMLAMAAYLWALGSTERWPKRAFVLAWLTHGMALLAHQFGIGEPGVGARFGFALALTMTLWLVMLVYAIESHLRPLADVRRALSIAGSSSLLLLLFYPGDPLGHPTSPWAPLHWVLGLVSYGLFGVAVLHALLLDRAERGLRSHTKPMVMEAEAAETAPSLPLLTLEKLTFRFVKAGFVALSLAIAVGWLSSPAWRWDHKMVFSLLGWLIVAGLLGGRHRLGWRGRRATRWLYAGAGFLLLAYVGSRFVVEVMLHKSQGQGMALGWIAPWVLG
jgi:ABC-type uncharacterized transport system permease subunit